MTNPMNGSAERVEAQVFVVNLFHSIGLNLSWVKPLPQMGFRDDAQVEDVEPAGVVLGGIAVAEEAEYGADPLD